MPAKASGHSASRATGQPTARSVLQFSIRAGLLCTTLVACIFGIYVYRNPPPERFPVVPVKGRITMDGLPFRGGIVVFYNRMMDGRPAVGVTDDQGHFSLGTYESPKRNLVEGALPGEYDVCVIKIESPPAGLSIDGILLLVETEPGLNILPQKYSIPGGSGIQATVTKGADNEFFFDVRGETEKKNVEGLENILSTKFWADFTSKFWPFHKSSKDSGTAGD